MIQEFFRGIVGRMSGGKVGATENSKARGDKEELGTPKPLDGSMSVLADIPEAQRSPLRYEINRAECISRGVAQLAVSEQVDAIFAHESSRRIVERIYKDQLGKHDEKLGHLRSEDLGKRAYGATFEVVRENHYTPIEDLAASFPNLPLLRRTLLELVKGGVLDEVFTNFPRGSFSFMNRSLGYRIPSGPFLDAVHARISFEREREAV
jgi:hypothetical protein